MNIYAKAIKILFTIYPVCRLSDVLHIILIYAVAVCLKALVLVSIKVQKLALALALRVEALALRVDGLECAA